MTRCFFQNPPDGRTQYVGVIAHVNAPTAPIRRGRPDRLTSTTLTSTWKRVGLPKTGDRCGNTDANICIAQELAL
jgi:hypothetical protein